MPEGGSIDIHCECGYDRQGLADDALCPECGVLEIRHRRRPPDSRLGKVMWYVWKVAIWDLFPMPPRRDTTAVMGSVAGRVSAIIGLWATISVLLWAWYAEENRSSDMADILLMWTGLLVLIGIPCNFVALIVVLASLGHDKPGRTLRNIAQCTVALILPPTVLVLMIIASL
jgi:hypothetical protein